MENRETFEIEYDPGVDAEDSVTDLGAEITGDGDVVIRVERVELGNVFSAQVTIDPRLALRFSEELRKIAIHGLGIKTYRSRLTS